MIPAQLAWELAWMRQWPGTTVGGPRSPERRRRRWPVYHEVEEA